MLAHEKNHLDHENSLLPMNFNDEEPVFSEPWQAQVLALAYSLIENQKIPANQWSETLGAELQHAKNSGLPDNKETYYEAALKSLEKLTETFAGISRSELNETKEAWRTAYLTTPHGSPVELPEKNASLQND